MRIVGSGTILRDRARRRSTLGLLLLALGLALLAGGFAASQSTNMGPLVSGLAAFVGFGALVLAWSQTNAAQRDAVSAAAEAPLLAQLRARLSDDYLYLRHVTLPGQRVEADAILLGPHGALVLAIMDAPGRFAVREDDWFTGAGDVTVEQAGQALSRGSGPTAHTDGLSPLRQSPTWSLTRRVRSLQRLARDEGLGALSVQGAVVLTRGELLAAERPALAVVPVGRIASFVEYLRPVDPEPLREPVQHLADLLTPLVAGQPRPRRATPRDASRS